MGRIWSESRLEQEPLGGQAGAGLGVVESIWGSAFGKAAGRGLSK